MTLRLLALLLASLSVVHAQDQTFDQVLEQFFVEQKMTALPPVSLTLWRFQARQARLSYDEMGKQWRLAKSDEERDSVVAMLYSEKFNLWNLDASEQGVLRKAIIGDQSAALTEITDYQVMRAGHRIRKPGGDLPMNHQAIMTRIRDGFHVGEDVERLHVDIRAAGLVSLGIPGFENLADIPKDVLDLMPEASDRQKLTAISTVDLPLDNMTYRYIILRNRVIKLHKIPR